MEGRTLVLGSGSAYRAELLGRLGLPFRRIAPAVDEHRQPAETVEAYVLRLAGEKALAAAHGLADAVVIGSDQAAELDGELLGKPGTAERAVEQLLRASGRDVAFHTAVAVYDTADGRLRTRNVSSRVRFRRLDRPAAERYVARDRPLDCAGSFRVEGYGITLFRRVEGEDPTALIGLPLIALVELLGQAGIRLP